MRFSRFGQTVDEQLETLRRTNDEEGWGISEADFKRLAFTAPEWPAGKYAIRSFRIRFGKGDEGVAQTFDAHVDRIHYVFGRKGMCFFATARKAEIRLRAGNQTHMPTIEWVTIDIGAHSERHSVATVRNALSLADELLVVMWLFSPRSICRGLTFCENSLPSLIAAGYEVKDHPTTSGFDCALRVGFDDAEIVVATAIKLSDKNDRYSVPVLLSQTAPSSMDGI